MKILTTTRITIHVPCEEFTDDGYTAFKKAIRNRKDYSVFDCDGEFYNIVLNTDNAKKAKKEISDLIKSIFNIYGKEQ